MTTSASLRALAFSKAGVRAFHYSRKFFLIRSALVDPSKPDDAIFDKVCDRFGLYISKGETI